MASSGRVQFGGFSIKSFLLTAVVIGLILALFFIPEIVSFQKSLRGRAQVAQPAGQEDTLIPSGSQEKVQMVKGDVKTSPLEQISGMINTGYIEQLKAKKLASSEKGGKTPIAGISWELLKSKPSLDALRAARKEAEGLAKKYSGSSNPARYALYNFINGIDMVLQSGERDMAASEAVRYLAFLHGAVLHATEREGADRNDYNRIAALNLGPAFSKAAALGEGSAVPSFNPRLTLTSVVVRKAPGRKGRWEEDRPVQVTMKGFAFGDDIKEGILYLNGNQVKKISFRKPNSLGRRDFRTGRMTARGVYTFRIYSKVGPVYQKSYAFYPRVRKFPWTRGGLFEIPFEGERDNRLDRFFTYRAGRILGQGGGGFFSGDFEKF